MLCVCVQGGNSEVHKVRPPVSLFVSSAAPSSNGLVSEDPGHSQHELITMQLLPHQRRRQPNTKGNHVPLYNLWPYTRRCMYMYDNGQAWTWNTPHRV